MKESKKVALITGITGQDGSYLSELLLEKDYTVHGIVRRTSNLLRSRIEHLRRDEKNYGRRLFLHYGDLSDSTTLRRILDDVCPTELYHLAGQSHVGLSFEIPESTCEETGMATLRLLEIVRAHPSPVKFYHASSAEIFGDASASPQVTRNGARTSVAAEILSCLERRDFWSRIDFAANREHGAAADEPVWLRQSVRNAIGTGLSTIVRTVCLQWYSLQP